MKNYFKFLSVATLVAAGLVGCSTTEVVPPDGDGTTVTPPVARPGEATYATFRFVDSNATTRADILSGDASESTTLTNLRVIIFDGAVKEVDTVFAATNATIKLTSGTKNLYVIQNAPGTIPTPSNVLASGAVLGTLMQGILSGVGAAQTLTDFGSVVYNIDATPGDAVGNIDNISGLFTPAFTLSNRFDSTQISLQANVTPLESQSAGNQNNIAVTIKRAVAKIFVSQTPNSGPGTTTETLTLDSAGVITTTPVTTYRVLNVLTELYPFQKFRGTDVMTPHFEDTYPAYEKFVARGQVLNGDTLGIGSGPSGTNNIDIVIAASPSPGAGASFYITENTALERRAATFAAVRAQFTPTKGHYVMGLDYNETGGGRFALTVGTSNATAGTFYYLKTIGGTTVTGLPAETIFAGTSAKLLGKKAIYHFENPSVANKTTLSDYETLVTDAVFDTYFKTYTNGYCYYRLDIGAGSAPNIAYGAKRNTHYQLNINAFNKLGDNRVADLIGTPGDKLKAETYMTVTVTIQPWVTANGDVIL